MVEKSREIVIISVVIIIIIITTGLSYFLIQNYSNMDDLTAMEARDRAERLALQWDPTAELGHVMAFDQDIIWRNNISLDGTCSQWRFYFVSSTTITNYSRLYYKALIVKVVNGIAFIEDEDLVDVNTYSLSTGPIKGWTIDSPEAIIIAKSNVTAVQWLSKMDNRLVMVKIINTQSEDQNPFWIITWIRPYTRTSFEVHIDCVTGEITEVYTGI